MKKRLHNPNLAKIHRSYSVEEIAALYDVHKGTVREWIKQGLPALTELRPMLVLGRDLADFHRGRRSKNKQSCKLGEMFCLGCRAPKVPAGNMTEFRQVTPTLGNLLAICPSCGSMMNRRINSSKLEQFCSILEVTFTQARERIVDRHEPSVIHDLR